MLPLPQSDLLEVLVALTTTDDAQISAAAAETLKNESAEDLLIAASGEETAPNVLAYLATAADGKQEVYEAAILNTRTPDQSLARLAATTTNNSLLELITMNQQRLVRTPEIIDAILGNPACSSEAERRARETRKEFFEKERGARQIADELRARGQTAAAEFFEAAELTTAAGELSIDDAWLIAQHIEVSDADLDDSWLPAERYDELVSETAADLSANVQRVLELRQLAVRHARHLSFQEPLPPRIPRYLSGRLAKIDRPLTGRAGADVGLDQDQPLAAHLARPEHARQKSHAQDPRCSRSPA